MNVYKDICGIHYPGGCNVSSDLIKEYLDINRLIKFVSNKVPGITGTLRDFLKQDKKNDLGIYREQGKLIPRKQELGRLVPKEPARRDSEEGEESDEGAGRVVNKLSKKNEKFMDMSELKQALDS